MGLDMYAGTVSRKPRHEVDFEPRKPTLLHQWRKHPDLHGWVEQLYWSKGGKGIPTGFGDGEFNTGCTVVLTTADLENLEKAVTKGTLPKTAGFFFGESDGTEVQDDLEFIAKARAAIAMGLTVFYDSWW
jgi:hypothetical protein